MYFEHDFSSNKTVFTSDILVTDWSSIFCEFCFSTRKPAIFIDTPMKVGNPDWKELGIEPTDIALRSEVGVSIRPEDAATFGDVAEEMLAKRYAWSDRINKVLDSFIFNVGHGGEVAGRYLLDRMIDIQESKRDGGASDDSLAAGERAAADAEAASHNEGERMGKHDGSEARGMHARKAGRHEA